MNISSEMDDQPEEQPEKISGFSKGDGLIDIYEPVFNLVRQVPSGTVVTYGQVAELIEGTRFTARQVGTAMRYAPKDVPWQRVVGAGGRLPIAKISPELSRTQRELLLQEGVFFLKEDGFRVDMRRCQWYPDGKPSLTGGLFSEDEI